MRISTSERVFLVITYLVIAMAAMTCLYPFLYVLATSFSSSRAVGAGLVYIWPVEFNMEAYKQLLLDGQVFVAMKNTVIITVVGTALNMFATVLCAYSLSKKRLRGRGIFMGIIVFTMLFSGGLIPSFLLMRSLNLMDKFSGLWALGLVSSFNMIVMRTFFEGLPESLEESAQIDGAADPVILIRLALPLSLPVLATITLFYAVGWWNSYFTPMMYLKTTTKYPLMLKLKQMIDTAQMIVVNQNTTSGTEGASANILIAPETFKAASILVATLPIVMIYPFLQKYFVKGVMIGSVKG